MHYNEIGQGAETPFTATSLFNKKSVLSAIAVLAIFTTMACSYFRVGPSQSQYLDRWDQDVRTMPDFPSLSNLQRLSQEQVEAFPVAAPVVASVVSKQNSEEDRRNCVRFRLDRCGSRRDCWDNTIGRQCQVLPSSIEQCSIYLDNPRIMAACVLSTDYYTS